MRVCHVARLTDQAMEMKSEGKYVARGLSFRDAEFTEMEAKLTPEQVHIVYFAWLGFPSC